MYLHGRGGGCGSGSSLESETTLRVDVSDIISIRRYNLFRVELVPLSGPADRNGYSVRDLKGCRQRASRGPKEGVRFHVCRLVGSSTHISVEQSILEWVLMLGITVITTRALDLASSYKGVHANPLVQANSGPAVHIPWFPCTCRVRSGGPYTLVHIRPRGKLYVPTNTLSDTQPPKPLDNPSRGLLFSSPHFPGNKTHIAKRFHRPK